MHFYMHSYLHKIFILVKSGCYNPPVMIVPETMAATAAVVMMMVMSARFLQSSATSSQAPTSGRLASMYQADSLALGAIAPPLVMAPSFFYE
jgi:hypothetical protein